MCVPVFRPKGDNESREGGKGIIEYIKARKRQRENRKTGRKKKKRVNVRMQRDACLSA